MRDVGRPVLAAVAALALIGGAMFAMSDRSGAGSADAPSRGRAVDAGSQVAPSSTTQHLAQHAVAHAAEHLLDAPQHQHAQQQPSCPPQVAPAADERLSALQRCYLDLLRDALTGLAFRTTEMSIAYHEGAFDVQKYLQPLNVEQREKGKDWPFVGLTMTGTQRLNNVEWALRSVIPNVLAISRRRTPGSWAMQTRTRA